MDNENIFQNSHNNRKSAFTAGKKSTDEKRALTF